MTLRVEIKLDDNEPGPVEVHRLFVGRYPPSDQITVLQPGETLAMHVWPGNEILIREPEPEEDEHPGSANV